MKTTYSLEAATALVDVRISNLQRRSKLEKVYLSSASNEDPIVRTRKRYLDAWSGETQNGQPVHISYHLGELSISIDCQVSGPKGRGASRPVTVLQWKPRYAQSMIRSLKAIKVQKARANKAGKQKCFSHGDFEKLRQSVQLEADHQERKEMRAQNGQARLLSKRQLTDWLNEHSYHFDTLRSLNIAGGKVRFRIESFHSQGLSM